MSPPGPVLSRCHGGDIVFWVCVHGLTHEGAVHVDRVITVNKIQVCALIILKLNIFIYLNRRVFIQALCSLSLVSYIGLSKVKGQRSEVLPFNGGVLILCEGPVCVRLLQLQGKGKRNHKANLNVIIKMTHSSCSGSQRGSEMSLHGSISKADLTSDLSAHALSLSQQRSVITDMSSSLSLCSP